MDEAAWFGFSDPRKFIWSLEPKASDRTFRLFACACARAVWPLLKDERSRRSVIAAEDYADNNGSGPHLETSNEAAWVAYEELQFAGEEAEILNAAGVAYSASIGKASAAADMASWPDEWGNEFSKIARDVFRAILQPVVVDPARLSWKANAIPMMAQAIYDDRAFDRLPILADALEEAGCTDADMLGHCRSPGPHVRGCWVLDLLLGKS
jgi:hypothetical protein